MSTFSHSFLAGDMLYLVVFVQIFLPFKKPNCLLCRNSWYVLGTALLSDTGVTSIFSVRGLSMYS